MNRRSKVELFEEIRLGYAAGETIKALAKKHGVHRRMVRQAIASSIPDRKSTRLNSSHLGISYAVFCLKKKKKKNDKEISSLRTVATRTHRHSAMAHALLSHSSVVLPLSLIPCLTFSFFFFFFNDTATTEIYTLSLHDALPISATDRRFGLCPVVFLQACSDLL